MSVITINSPACAQTTTLTTSTFSTNSCFNYENILERFIAILEKNQDNQDDLSNQIFEWGVDVIQIKEINPEIEERALLTILAEKIEVFKKTINFNPVSCPFGNEVLSLINEVSNQINRQEASLPCSTSNELELFSSRPEYALFLEWQNRKLQKKAEKYKKEKQEQDWILNALMKVDDLVESSRNETRLILQQMQEHVALHEQELELTLQDINEAHTREINNLNEIIRVMEEKHLIDISTLNKRQDAIDQTNSIISNELSKQIVLVTKEHETAIQVIQGEINTINKSYQQTINCLNNQFNHTLSSQKEQLKSVQSSLKIAQDKNNKNALKLRDSKKQLEEMRKQIAQLRAMANDDSGGLGCIIL